MREWSTLRKLMLTKGATGAPLIEYTATGNPLSFNTNKAKPLKSLTIPWTPVQSGIGDPSPSNVRPISGVSAVNVWRTGKNLIDNTKRYMASGHVLFIGAEDDNYRVYLKAGTYRLTVVYAEGKGSAGYYRRDGDSATRLWQSGSNTGTFTLSSDSYCNLYLYGSSLESDDVTSFMLTSGSDEATYEAYTGTTKSIVFPALGKNLLYTESITAQGNQFFIGGGASVYPFELKAGTYTLSCGGSNSYAYCSKKGETSSITIYNASNHGTFTINSDGEYRFWFYLPGASATDFYNIMLEKGSTQSPYEPYTNTVYGGSLDVVSGVLNVTHKTQLLDDADAWNDGETFISYTGHEMNDRKTGNSYGFVCSCFPAEQKSSGTAYIRWGGTTSKNILIAKNGSELTLADVKTLSSSKDIIICYELAEAQTIQLSATQISALLGDNVIWSDTNGTNTAIYFKKG